MGAVEIIVALHYVFNTPEDRLVFDVGHQAYAHKILTGRREAFASLRTLGGISGFPTPLESDSDTFMAGHAGNSISAALGMATADKCTPGNTDRKTVALIGDASISNGIAFEGLNNASNHPNDLLIVLNDNEMSIDDNVGALHRYLSKITTSAGYNSWRHKIYEFFKRKGIIGDRGRGRILRFNNSIKALISKQQNIFEGLNIRYFGPIDGHNVENLVRVLSEIKDMKGPRLLHICTTKGKGYAPAENNPTVWHAPGKFDAKSGIRQADKVTSNEKEKTEIRKNWQNVFGEYLVELAADNERIVGITAAMPSGTSMGMMMKAYPHRAFDVGISEGHAVTFAGGLAAAGKHPFVAIYSSFLQRAYDNIIHDVAIQNLPVTLCIDRAGLVGEDGVTHHGFFDIAYLRCIPNLHIASPADAQMLRNLMLTASRLEAPMAIRYPRGKAPAEKSGAGAVQAEEVAVGKGRNLVQHPGAEIAILTIGDVAGEALKAAQKLHEDDIPADVYDMVWVKPLDVDLLVEIAGKYRAIITVEDGVASGGFGSAVLEALCERGIQTPVHIAAIPDRWIMHGSVAELRKQCGIDAAGIEAQVRSLSHKKLIT